MNENTYTSQQAQKLRSQADLFSVSQIGQTIVVSSLKNQLWVEWQMDGTVEIGVGLNTKKKLYNCISQLPESSGNRVKGLCGNFNGLESDDRTGRAGEVTIFQTTISHQALRSTHELVRAWEEPGFPSCNKDSCTAGDKTEAWRLCNTIK